MQFLIPFTKTRPKNSATIIAQRKAAAAGNIPPMTRISNMPTVSSDDTKDSSNSAEVAAIAEGDVVVSLQEGVIVGGVPIQQHAPIPLPQPLNLQTIKQEKDVPSGNISTTMDHLLQSLDQQRQLVSNTTVSYLNSNNINNNNINKNNITTNPTINNLNNTNNNNNNCTSSLNAITPKSNSNSSGNNNNNMITTTQHTSAPPPPTQSGSYTQATETRTANTVDLMEFAEWIKSKNDYQRHCLMTTSPDADQSFLNSLHPYLREMSGKQNRRFRQKVVALIDAILDNAD